MFPPVGASYQIIPEPVTGNSPTVSPVQNVWLENPVGAAVGLIVAVTVVLVDVQVAAVVST